MTKHHIHQAFRYHYVILTLIAALLSSAILPNTSLAARYEAKVIDNGTAVAINNLGRAVGASNGVATYWTVSSATDAPILPGIALEIPLFDENGDLIPIIESAATAINDTNDTSNLDGESIVGWYITERDGKRAVVWKRNTTGLYISIPLPLYRRTLSLCNPQTPEELDALNELRRGPRVEGSCLETNQLFVLPEPTSTPEPTPNPEPTPTPDPSFIPVDINSIDSEKLSNIWNLSVLPDCIDDTTGEIIIYSKRDIKDGVIVDCRDTENEAIGVNDNGIIIGRSFDSDGNMRPIYWGISDGGGLASENYTANDLRDHVENNAIKQRRTEVFAIDKTSDTIIGAYFHETELTERFPIVWLNVSANGFNANASETLASPIGIDTVAQAINDTQFVGWTLGDTRKDASGNLILNEAGNPIIDKLEAPIPILWTQSSAATEARDTCNKDNTKSVEECNFPIYLGAPIPTLINNGSGELLAVNTLFGNEYLGTGISASNTPRAILFTNRCGTQDLNDLIIQPNEGQIILTAATATAHQNFTDNALDESIQNIIATGTLDGVDKTFILTPKLVNLDLSVVLTANHNEIVVGQKHIYTIKISNHSTSESYATCINLIFETKVVINSEDEHEPGEIHIPNDPHKSIDERAGGLTYLSSLPEGACNDGVSPIVLRCKINRIDPGQTTLITVTTRPRALLADRTVKASASITSTEFITKEVGRNKIKTDLNPDNNSTTYNTRVNREGCFIATAAFGSYLDPRLDFLRQFRDQHLQPYALGQWLIEYYYRYSPPIAHWIENKEILKAGIRLLLMMLIIILSYPISSLIVILSILSGSLAYLHQPKRLHQSKR